MLDSEALNLAADHIQVFGHCKNSLGSPGQPCCALGALHAATGTALGGLAPGSWLLSRYLGSQMIHVWNNAEERTAEEVIETLRAVALIAASQECEASRERETAEVSA